MYNWSESRFRLLVLFIASHLHSGLLISAQWSQLSPAKHITTQHRVAVVKLKHLQSIPFCRLTKLPWSHDAHGDVITPCLTCKGRKRGPVILLEDYEYTLARWVPRQSTYPWDIINVSYIHWHSTGALHSDKHSIKQWKVWPCEEHTHEDGEITLHRVIQYQIEAIGICL